MLNWFSVFFKQWQRLRILPQLYVTNVWFNVNYVINRDNKMRPQDGRDGRDGQFFSPQQHMLKHAVLLYMKINPQLRVCADTCKHNKFYVPLSLLSKRNIMYHFKLSLNWAACHLKFRRWVPEWTLTCVLSEFCFCLYVFFCLSLPFFLLLLCLCNSLDCVERWMCICTCWLVSRAERVSSACSSRDEHFLAFFQSCQWECIFIPFDVSRAVRESACAERMSSACALRAES